MFTLLGYRKMSLLILMSCIVYVECTIHPVVTTPLGEIQGSFLKTRLGNTINAFRGIRYAEAPVGTLRFQPPVPVSSWKWVYNATVDGAYCPQPNRNGVPMSEDCLFLNVYSTKLPSKRHRNVRRPVIVFFHAGGFYSVSGVSSIYGPQYFMDQDIVLVTANYRLGSLGFLSTGTKEAPGNNGLKDQVEVMKWVNKNIAVFGGNPDLVTVGGYSAGGLSATVHLVSPLSRGLFHRIIAMSGSVFGPLPIPTSQYNLAQKQARLVGCPDDTPQNIVSCLMNVSATELGNSLGGFDEFGIDPIWIWTPVIEPDFGQPRFLTEHPLKLLLKGDFVKVPILAGVTKDEFGALAYEIVLNDTLLQDFDQNYTTVWPISFCYERNTENSKKISRNFRQYFFGEKAIGNETFSSIANLYSDGIIGFAVNRGVKLLAERNTEPVYYYRFSYQGRYSHNYKAGIDEEIPFGVSHHDDLIYLFYISSLFPKFTENDPESVTVRKLTTLWANFAKTGNPIPKVEDSLGNVQWLNFDNKNQWYMDIGEDLVMKKYLYKQRYSEWERQFPLHNI